MYLKGEYSSGGKISKNRLQLPMLCVNIDGDFETPLVIGKALRPRCFTLQLYRRYSKPTEILSL